jgi:hypothetical protein
MDQSSLMEFRMGRKVLSAIENLVKIMRNTGPFGGSQIEPVNIKTVLKRAEEEVHSKEIHFKKKPSFVNTSKIIKVYLEDKYMKQNRTLVEEYIVETLEIPDDLNGFEYLFHPHLEKPESLAKFFNNWLSTTLNSLYYLLEGVALSRYFLNPVSEEEIEVANELRRRYNLNVESEEFDLRDGTESQKPNKTLETLFKSRQYIHKLLIKKRIYIFKNYKEIIEEIRQSRASPTSALVGLNGPTCGPLTLAHLESRKRFFSDNYCGILGATLSSPMKMSEATKGGNQSTGRIRLPSEDFSLDLSASSSISNRPFKLQESLIEERVQLHKRKISVDSLSMLKRTNSQAVDLAEEMGQIDYVLSQKEEDTRDTTSRITGEDDSSGNMIRKGQTKLTHRKSSTGIPQVGLACIGNQLLKSGTITDDCLELDEDDRLMELFATIEQARSEIHLITKSTLDKEHSRQNNVGQAARVVFNLFHPKNSPIEEQGRLEDWLIGMKKMSTNLK